MLFRSSVIRGVGRPTVTLPTTLLNTFIDNTSSGSSSLVEIRDITIIELGTGTTRTVPTINIGNDSIISSLDIFVLGTWIPSQGILSGQSSFLRNVRIQGHLKESLITGVDSDIRGCSITQAGDGVTLATAQPVSIGAQSKLIDCKISGAYDKYVASAVLTTLNSAIIDGCVISEWGWAATNDTIISNCILNYDVSAITSRGSVLTLDSSSVVGNRITVTSVNAFSGNSIFQILNGTGNAPSVLSDNTIRATGTSVLDVLLVADTDAVVTGNGFNTNVTTLAETVYITGSKVVFNGNGMNNTSAPTNAALLHQGSYGTICGNIVICPGDAVSISAAGNTVTGNTFDGQLATTKFGVKLLGASTNNRVGLNIFKGYGGTLGTSISDAGTGNNPAITNNNDSNGFIA